MLGDDVVLTSDPRMNMAGMSRRVTLAAPFAGGEIVVGDHTGLSGVVVFAVRSVRIGRHVNVGVNVSIYDNDFHALDWKARRANDLSQVAVAPVVIEDDAWIGGNAMILKGVHIGRGAVVGAGSVVTSDIPAGTVWAGNPAKFIKKLPA